MLPEYLDLNNPIYQEIFMLDGTETKEKDVQNKKNGYCESIW
jgi:hypothetical protein